MAKAAAWFARETDSIPPKFFEFGNLNQADYKVATMCRLLGVTRSGYYAWLNRSPSARSIEDAPLTRRIEAIYKGSRGTYGVPRTHAELVEDDQGVSRERI